MTHRIACIPVFSLVLALGACRGDREGATATAGTTTEATTTAATTTTTAPGTTTAATTTTGPGTTTTEATTTGATQQTTTIRFAHLAPDAPAVDIFANGNTSAPAFDGLQVRSSETVTLPAGEYAFAIAPDGGALDQAVFQVPSQSYEAGKRYTLVALGKLADKSFEVVRLEDQLTGLDTTKVRLQVTHAAAAAPFAEVDVWTGPRLDMLTLLLDDFRFKGTRSADLTDDDVVLAVDLDEDTTPDIVWNVPGAALTPALGGLIHVFAYSDAEDRPSLQIVATDGPTSQLDPTPNR